jgi:hypothetical protein
MMVGTNGRCLPTLIATWEKVWREEFLISRFTAGAEMVGLDDVLVI